MKTDKPGSSMSSTLHSATAAPAALSAFLRGIERRAAVFAELQCGDIVIGERALAAAMRAFRNHASAAPMVEWPQRFWTLLTATPGLRQPGQENGWPSGLEALAGLDPADRRALLLRLAAGLEEEPAAAAAGMDAAGYRAALAAACPRDLHGDPDAAAWRVLAEAVQQKLRNLPPDQLARLTRLREAAIEGTRQAPRVEDDPRARPVPTPRSTPRRHWRWAGMAAVAVALALALAATWYWPSGSGDDDRSNPWADPQIEIESLPESEPAARLTDAQALLLHPDRELLLDPEEPALSSDAAFLAWYSAATEVRPEAIAEPSDVVDVSSPEELASAPP
jgi:hypothetical protein